MRRPGLVYVAGLLLAAAAVFLATYFFGRKASLENELERLTARRPSATPGKTAGIPSLQQREAPPVEQKAEKAEEGVPLGEGVVALRSALESPGLVVVADLPALAAGPGGAPPGSGQPVLRAGLDAFLARPPAGLWVGVRALAGAEGECGGTDQVRPPGPWGHGELVAALDAAAGLGRGPRNPAKAAEAAMGDLAEAAGEHAVVILAGDAEGCPADLCGSNPPPGGGAARIHLVLLARPPEPGAQPDMPEAGTAGAPAPVFDPSWGGPYRCLAERTGGTVSTASSPAELEGALRRIAADMESAIVVRAIHGTGQEVRGISPGGDAGWGVVLRPGGSESAQEAGRLAELFPASFALPGGVYVVKARYAGQEKTAAVAVAPGERVEVRVTFPTGELFVQALDASGQEIAGDSAGFGCAWGTEVLQGEPEEQTVVARSCSLPSRFELSPGVYRARVRWKGQERSVDEAAVEGGASTVRAVSFGTGD
ncbi:MAG TPA: hypothetical protein VI078_08690 [bacterium]